MVRHAHGLMQQLCASELYNMLVCIYSMGVHLYDLYVRTFACMCAMFASLSLVARVCVYVRACVRACMFVSSIWIFEWRAARVMRHGCCMCRVCHIFKVSAIC